MRQKVISTQNRQNSCTIIIEYDDPIRSIDLEHFLSSLRMIYQNELAERTGGKTRNFTNSVKIQSINKGSIAINFLCDFVNINIDAINVNVSLADINIDLVDIILLYLSKDKVSKKMEGPLKIFMACAQRFKKVILKNNYQCSKIEKDNDGKIIVTPSKN